MSSSSPIVKARLKPALHARFLAELEARGLTESELLRLALCRLFADTSTVPPHREGDAHATRSVVEPDPAHISLTRKTVWMPSFLMKAACERAGMKGMAFSRWVCSLVQSHLMRDPVLTQAELLGIEAATRELAVSGRYLHQILRALDEAHFEMDRIRLDKLVELAANINAVREGVRTLIRASRHAWEVD